MFIDDGTSQMPVYAFIFQWPIVIVDFSDNLRIDGNLQVKNWHFFLTHPDLMPSLGVILSAFPDKPYSPKTRIMGP